MLDIPGVDFIKAWEKRIQSHYGETPIFIMALDDLITAKEKAGRDQDLLDLKNLRSIKEDSSKN